MRAAFDIIVRLPAGSDVSPVVIDLIGTFTDMEVIDEDLADRATALSQRKRHPYYVSGSLCQLCAINGSAEP